MVGQQIATEEERPRALSPHGGEQLVVSVQTTVKVGNKETLVGGQRLVDGGFPTVTGGPP